LPREPRRFNVSDFFLQISSNDAVVALWKRVQRAMVFRRPLGGREELRGTWRPLGKKAGFLVIVGDFTAREIR
jgi:hypothetical protein